VPEVFGNGAIPQKEANLRAFLNFVKALVGEDYEGYCSGNEVCCKYETPKERFLSDEEDKARIVFTDYYDVLSGCKETNFGKCFCGSVDTTDFGDYSILAVKGTNGRVNISLIPGKIHNMNEYVNTMNVAEFYLNIDYNSIFNYLLSESYKYTQIYLDNSEVEVFGSNDLQSEFSQVNSPEDSNLKIIRNGDKLYNAYSNKQIDFPKCSFYFELNRVFQAFNNNLNQSLEDNSETVFSKKIPKDHSIAVDSQKEGLNVSLLHYEDTHYSFKWDTWKPISSIFYPNADFYAYEKKSHGDYYDIKGCKDYAWGNNVCHKDNNGVSYCFLKNYTLSEKNYRIIGLRFDYKNNHFEVIKRYGLVSHESVNIGGVKEELDWKYTDSKVEDYDHHPRIKFDIAV
jgi:hypothetical protein